MEEAQAKLAEQELTGTSGGGMVKITLNGKFEMKKVEIDKSMLEEEDVSILEDMIAAAYNDAHAKVDASMAEGMKDRYRRPQSRRPETSFLRKLPWPERKLKNLPS